MDSDSTLVHVVNPMSTPIGSVNERPFLSRNDSEASLS
jgi:hypothetical protein